MKTSPEAARRLLRDSNPVPGDAFPDVDGRAVLTAILATPEMTSARPRRPRWRAVALPGRSAIRGWKVAVPAAAMAAALAGILTVMLTATSGPQPGMASQPSDSGFATLIADLTARPQAHPGDAAAVLRQLADAAATSSAVPLGPVEYSEIESWGLDLDRPLQYNLSYVSHETSTSYAWMGPDGSFLGYYTVPGGKYEQGTIPLQQNGPSQAAAARFAWYDPAALPPGIAALRAHLVNGPAAPRGQATGGGTICTVSESAAPGGTTTPVPAASVSCGPAPRPALIPDPATSAIVFDAEALMRSEPLPSAVRAALLRVLADSAAQGLNNARLIDMGTVADRAGHAGVAIGYESPDDSGPPGTQSHLEVLVFDPATGALLGDEDAYCKGLASSYPAAGSCTPEGYDQILQVKAVQAIPPRPKLPPVPRWTPTTPSQAPTLRSLPQPLSLGVARSHWHKFYSSAIAAPPELLFRLLSDLPNYGDWLPGSQAYGQTTDVTPYPVRHGTRYHDGKPDEPGKDWWGTVTGFQPSGSLDFHQTIPVRQLAATVDVRIHYSLEAEDGGTAVTRWLILDIAMPFAFLPARPLITANFDKENHRTMAALKDYAESREKERDQ